MEQSISDFFEEEYLNAENKRELDYWAPLCAISSGFTELMANHGVTIEKVSKDLDIPLKTLQSIHNLDTIPQYDLVEKLCHYFNQKPSVSLYGAYTATLSSVYHKQFEALAKSKKRDVKTLLEDILEKAVVEELKEGG